MLPVPRRYPVCRDVAPYLLLGPAWLPREPRPTRPTMTGPGRRRHSKARASRLACPGRREHAGRAGPYALSVRRGSPLRRLATPRPARPVPGPVARLSVALFWWRAEHVLNCKAGSLVPLTVDITKPVDGRRLPIDPTPRRTRLAFCGSPQVLPSFLRVLLDFPPVFNFLRVC